MDDLDYKIISMLKQDASVSLTVVAKKLGVPEPTVYFRVNKLKKEGRIHYTIRVVGDSEDAVHAAVLTPKSFLLSEMTKRIPDRIGETLAEEPDVLFAAKTGDNKILVVWRGSVFNPAMVDGVKSVDEKAISVYKKQ